ncbi:MAG: T9SS type A sorting domain-containing protein [Fimbriimonadaceae bacterium]|nr:T9SS type A sorting domain-containing protein [Chitinophagales bacterium]
MRYLTLVFINLLIAGNIFSQSLFADFTAQQFGDSVFIKWTLKAGNTCFDMHVERSTDDIYFETIHSVPGLCGATSDLYYTYFDNYDLMNGTYYYRITGSNDVYVSNTVEAKYIDAGNNLILAYPNPSDNVININISNDLNLPIQIELISSEGKSVHLNSTSQYQHTIPSNTIAKGPYVLKMTDDRGVVISQKIILQ